MIQAFEILDTSYYVYQVFILWIITLRDSEKYYVKFLESFIQNK